MNNELIQSAKDQAAREYGYRNWKDIYSSFDSGDLTYQKLEIVIDDAMEIYAELVAVKFAEHVDGLPHHKRCTVHPPAGSGGSHGIYLLTTQELFNRFKTTKP